MRLPPLLHVCSFQDEAGKIECKVCGDGFYQGQAGQLACTAIPAGSYGTGGDGLTRTGVSLCDVGSSCPGGGAAPVQCNGVTLFQVRRGLE